MPIFNIIPRECGEDFTVESLLQRRRDLDSGKHTKDTIDCACGLPARIEHHKTFKASKLPGYKPSLSRAAKGIYHEQTGITFENAKALDQWADDNDQMVVSRSSNDWHSVLDDAHNKADTNAREAGYNNSEHMRANLKKDLKDHVAAARQEQINQYHDLHGSEGKQSVDGSTFGALPDSGV